MQVEEAVVHRMRELVAVDLVVVVTVGVRLPVVLDLLI
jgi:hypothetical protein